MTHGPKMLYRKSYNVALDTPQNSSWQLIGAEIDGGIICPLPDSVILIPFYSARVNDLLVKWHFWEEAGASIPTVPNVTKLLQCGVV